MGTNFHFLTNALLAVVCGLMGTSFLSLHVPKKEGLLNYRISLNVLASAYFVLGLLALTVLIFNLSDNSREFFTYVITAISSLQALLFTFTLITLINPRYIKIRYLVYHLIPFLIFTFLFIISNLIFGNPEIANLTDIPQNFSNPTIWIRLLFFGFYIFQLIYYSYLFINEAKRYDNELLEYFSEVFQLKMRWVRIAFFAALVVGITAMISYFFPKEYDWIFNLVYAIFYFGFAQEYIKYNRIFSIIEPAILVETSEVSTGQSKLRIKTDWSYYKNEVSAHRYYCEVGINIEEMARKLNIGRTTLSTFINREEGVNFNTWINKLRIEEAKHLLIENPDYSIAIISEMVGYTEQANFSRQFKQITGESPLVWRKKLAAS